MDKRFYNDPSPVGVIIRARLSDKKMSQAELARAIGMRPRQLTQIVNGWRRIPREPWLDRIAEVLGIKGSDYDQYVAAAYKPQLRRPSSQQNDDDQLVMEL